MSDIVCRQLNDIDSQKMLSIDTEAVLLNNQSDNIRATFIQCIVSRLPQQKSFCSVSSLIPSKLC